MARKLTGLVQWNFGSKVFRRGKANVTWEEDGALRLDLWGGGLVDGGSFKFGVEIKATSDRGRWKQTYGGDRGYVFGALSKTATGFELHGKWYEDGKEYSWQVGLKEVDKLTDEFE